MAQRVPAACRSGILLLILLLLSSCATTIGIPYWARKGSTVQRGSQVTTIVASGEDKVAFNARLEAQRAILASLSELVGSDLTKSAWREFSTTDAVAGYGLSITREYRKGDTTWLEAEASSRLIAENRSEIENERAEVDAIIAAKLADVNAAYRENRDGEAIDGMLDIISIAASRPSSSSMDDLVRRTVKYIEAVRFSLSRRNEEKRTVRVKIRRKTLMFSPKIAGARVLATFPAKNVWGEEEEDSLVFPVGEESEFVFQPLSAAMADAGTVTFRLDVGDKLSTLKGVLDEGYYQQIENALHDHEVTFSYDRVTSYAGAEVLYNVHMTDSAGHSIEHAETDGEIRSFLEEKKMDPVAVGSDSDEQEDLVSAYAGTAPYLVLADYAVEETPATADGTLTVAVGRIRMYDLSDGEVVMDTGEISITDPDRDTAFRRLREATLTVWGFRF